MPLWFDLFRPLWFNSHHNDTTSTTKEKEMTAKSTQSVYQIYGLTDKEIALVEGTTAK